MQLPGGSWNGSLGWTAWRLGQLRDLDLPVDHPGVRHGLAWLAGRLFPEGDLREREEIVNRYPTVAGDEVAVRRRGIDATAYVLDHLGPWSAGVPALARVVEYIVERYPGGRHCCPRCTAALAAALTPAAVPVADDRVRAALAWLASIQREGRWRGTEPADVFLVLDAVARHPGGEPQVRNALPYLRRLARPDGAWGDAHRSEKTFAVLRALARHGLLGELTGTAGGIQTGQGNPILPPRT
jgi:hypothetical protein